ncbi:sodium:solute symporter family protein [Hoyosella rhizosphaerae]|uniref:Sodium:solute symporter n=1 Tax=Hoyosella rhizosphaerae TaxID=1755582 RepID=A0A916U442_9ACTN|nr:sodium:solute symporter family protein [Hoyosella rhizosphaerae]MBN4926602.1 sodium:solute symporter family protein [Hoyosella rhizosphaerae]GGC57975.1 sodium:solute symporter [Hoyosella rhizosphaerae]
MIITGVALCVLALLITGVYAARRVHGSSNNYLLAGRTLAIPIVAILLASQAVDSNGILGNTDLAASFGFWAGAALPVGLALCLIIAGIFFAKPMREYRIVTLPDFFERRFGRSIELPASILTVTAFGILVAGNLVALGFLLEHFAGIPYTVAILIAVPIVISYTIAGGMFSSAYIGIAMITINFFGMLALFGWMVANYGLSSPDGFSAFALSQLTDPAEGAVINWATIVALALGNLVAIDLMQRIFSARCPRTAQKACFGGAALILIICIPFSLVALTAVSVLGDSAGSGPVLYTLLGEYAPPILAVVVLSGIVTASLTTASGVLLSCAAVITRNIFRLGQQESLESSGAMTATRIAMIPMALLGAFVALRIPQTGILLTLTFDLLLAGLVVPFILGLYWKSRGTVSAAMAAIIAGVSVRVTLFALTPTIYGMDNTLLYIPNSIFDEAMDGWATFIAAAISLAAYVAVAMMTKPVHVAIPAPPATPAPVLRQPEPVHV